MNENVCERRETGDIVSGCNVNLQTFSSGKRKLKVSNFDPGREISVSAAGDIF